MSRRVLSIPADEREKRRAAWVARMQKQLKAAHVEVAFYEAAEEMNEVKPNPAFDVFEARVQRNAAQERAASLADGIALTQDEWHWIDRAREFVESLEPAKP